MGGRPGRLRQVTRAVREAQGPAAGEAPAAARPWRFGPYDGMSGWLRGFALAMAVGLFLALSGAFGTLEIPLWRRLAYWLGLMAAGTVMGGAVARLFFPRGDPPGPARRLWLNGLLASLAMSAPFTVVVWLGSRLILGGDLPLSRLPVLFVPVLMVALVMTALNTLVERQRTALALAAAAPSPPKPVKFLERLPLRLRGADLWAVEAEDHYLRLHTSRGQDLILMRLADAVAELDGLEGAQVHRSWWVARAALTDVKLGDGRATLTLKDGAQVPVSRTYAKALREAGWY